jgi:cardiolipin synthase
MISTTTKIPSKSHSLSLSKPWTGEKLYFKGDDYFKDVLKAIQTSKQSIDFEVYIYEKGVLADRITEALREASSRGVKVRLMVDGVGSPDADADYGQKLIKGGAEFRIYHRLPSFFMVATGIFGFLLRKNIMHRLRISWFQVNRRNHRKLVIVDQQRIWMGGFNVSDHHLESVKGKNAWRDTGLGLSGVKDKAFHLAFEIAWNERIDRSQWKLARKELITWLSRRTAKDAVQVNAARRLRHQFHKDLLERLRTARKRIWVTTPYFVPTLPVFRALIHAALRGCDVRLVLPKESDVPMVRWVSMSFFHSLLKVKCRIFEYQKSILHAKTLVVDDWVLVGSSNFNHRSFLFDLEVDVVLQRTGSLKILERQYQTDFQQSREVVLADVKLRPFWSRFLTWLVFGLRRWF